MKNFENLEELFERLVNVSYKDKDNVDIRAVATKSFIDYAAYVILNRALPDLRDGLKPSQRRILFAMKGLQITPNGGHKKSARIVGQTIGLYHPHGDTAVYETMVNMSQEWKNNLPLIDGQGNWGSIDGDNPAAMRYTEARFTKESSFLFKDINSDTVDFVKNYDGTEVEPSVLPTPFPNILINGVLSGSIAVGMSSSILPHNPTEVMNSLDLIISNKLEKKETLAEDILELIPAPDFPTGGTVYNTKNMIDIIKTGRGSVKLRANYEIEELKRGKKQIVFTTIPFSKKKSIIIEDIVNLKRKLKDSSIMNNITTIRDESSSEGIRIVIELKPHVNEDIVLNFLYKNSDLDISLNYNSVVIDKIQKKDNIGFAPKEYGLLKILERYIDFTIEVLIRKWTYIKNNTEKQIHILEGLIKALDNIDKIIAIIKKSRKFETAKQNLIKEFNFSEEQSIAILNIKLSKLTSLEKKALLDKLKELKNLIKESIKILNNENYRLEIIKQEYKDIHKEIEKPRKTNIISEIKEVDITDTIQKEDLIVYVTNKGYVKKVPKKYFSSKKISKEKLTIELTDNDYIQKIFDTDNHKFLFFVLNNGQTYSINIHDLPDSNRGTFIGNLFNLEGSKNIINSFIIDNFESKDKILFVMENGLVKKSELSDYKGSLRKTGILGINTNNSNIKNSFIVNDSEDIIIFTKMAKSIKFKVSDISVTGRATKGVKGIKLKKEDLVINSIILKENSNEVISTITEFGQIKSMFANSYKEQNRSGVGVFSMTLNKKSGELISVLKWSYEDNFIFKVIYENGNSFDFDTKELKINNDKMKELKEKLLENNENRILKVIKLKNIEEINND